MLSPAERPSLAFIGGTGPEGRGLAIRFALSGFQVILGSRSHERADAAAAEVREVCGVAVEGTENARAAEAGDVVILTIPYAGIDGVATVIGGACAGKIVVSTIAPVEFRDGHPVALHVPVGSAAQEVQQKLPESRVVSAFQTVDAHQLHDPRVRLDTDVIVCSDDRDARRAIVDVAKQLDGIRAFSGGRLSSSRYVEETTALLIILNRIYRTHSGIRITGIDR